MSKYHQWDSLPRQTSAAFQSALSFLNLDPWCMPSSPLPNSNRPKTPPDTEQ